MDGLHANGANQPPERGFRLEVLEIDPLAGLVSGPGGRETLDPKVMAVLVLMTRHTGQIVSRDELLAQLWPNRVVTDDAVTRCFYVLRRQLSQAGGDSRYRGMIETLPRRGYRLKGEITSLKLPSAADASKSVDHRSFKIAVAMGAATALILLIVSLGAG